MRRDRRHVRGEVAAREETTVYHRVERLHPPVEHLWELCRLADVGDREPRLAERLRRPPGGEEGEAEGVEPLGERDQTRLI